MKGKRPQYNACYRLRKLGVEIVTDRRIIIAVSEKVNHPTVQLLINNYQFVVQLKFNF